MPALPEHTSAAQLNLYSRCPRAYRYRYVDDAVPEFKSPSLALGSAVGSSIAWWFEERRVGHVPTIIDAKAIVRADLNAATVGNVRWGRWTAPDLERRAERLVECFLSTHGALNVIGTEVRFELPLYDPATGEVLPRMLVGYFDLVLKGNGVVEIKTSQGEYDDVDVARSLQFGGYTLALEDGGLPAEIELLVLVKRSTPKLQQIRVKQTPTSKRWFLEAASAIERSIAAGLFPPAPGMNCDGCEYQSRCLGVAGVGHAKAA